MTKKQLEDTIKKYLEQEIGNSFCIKDIMNHIDTLICIYKNKKNYFKE